MMHAMLCVKASNQVSSGSLASSNICRDRHKPFSFFSLSLDGSRRGRRCLSSRRKSAIRRAWRSGCRGSDDLDRRLLQLEAAACDGGWLHGKIAARVLVAVGGGYGCRCGCSRRRTPTRMRRHRCLALRRRSVERRSVHAGDW